MFRVEVALLSQQEEILGEVPETLKNRGSALKANSSRSMRQNDSHRIGKTVNKWKTLSELILQAQFLRKPSKKY